MANPELSIIIPTLNESDQLPELFANLAEQEKVDYEVIICDGGSSDNTCAVAVRLATAHGVPAAVLSSPAGRGLQMNQGAAAASAVVLLFLHADSRFPTTTALFDAAQAYKAASDTLGSDSLAARFQLRFRRQSTVASLAYHFYESKAMLDRPDCIRGDQGFLLSRSFFERLGGFDTSLPYLEDIRLARLIADHGQWFLLPVSISTSARRFETEGLCQRQILNAIIVNNLEVGWNEFFTNRSIYRTHASTGKLLLNPLLEGIRQQIRERPADWRRAFWLATGKHVSSNIWQLFFWLDARRHFRGGGAVRPEWLNRYQHHLEPYVKNRLVVAITASFVYIWLRLLLAKTWFQRS